MLSRTGGLKMNELQAVEIIEDDEEHTEEEIFAAWQYLVDANLVGDLQGWYGYTAQFLIENGLIKPSERAENA